jgi:uncharacterized protein YdaU (DUF1376 family)
MTTRPWMPLYVADYQLDTRDLSAEEHGVYLLLLMCAWRRPGGTLPNDKKWLRANLPPMHGLTYNRIVPPILERFFALDENGCWCNERLEKEKRNSEEISENAKRNAEERWAKERKNKHLADAEAMLSQSQSQSHTHKEKKDNPADAGSSSIIFFEAGVIRLTEKDFNRWQAAFPALNLRGELVGMADWAGRQGKGWFSAVAGLLAKRDREALLAKERVKLALAEEAKPRPAVSRWAI